MRNNQRSQDDTLICRGDWQYISVLLGIGFLTRIVFFSQIYLISLDGAFQYIPVAKLFAWGDHGEAVHQLQLPLYPFLIGIVTKLTGNFELSGQIISLIVSILAVIPLFLLGKSIFGEAAAFWTCIFYLFNPEMLQRSVDILKEGLLIFFLFSAVFLFYLFLSRRRTSWLVASIIVTLLAMLTRVVSLTLVPVFIFWILFLKKKPFDINFYKRLGYILVILALCSTVIIPLGMNIKEVTGHWDISKKTVTIRYLIESILFDKKVEMGQVEREPLKLVRKIIKVYHPLIFLFLLAGLIGRRATPRDLFREMFLFSFIFGYLIIIGIMMWSTQRYLFFPILLSYLWAGAGAVEIQEKVMKRIHLSPQKATLGLCILVFVVFLPVLLKPQRVDKLPRKAIGLWIKDQEIGRPLILTDAERVAYYAEGDLLIMNEWNYKRNISEPRAKGIKYIVVERENIEKKYPGLLELIKKDFSLQKVPLLTEKDQEKYFVFKSRHQG